MEETLRDHNDLILVPLILILIGTMAHVRKIFSVLFIALNLCTVLYGDIGHTDDILSGLQSVQTVRSHDCGAKERHRDIPSTHVCLACYRTANSAARLSSASIIGPSLTFTEFLVRILPASRQSTHYYHSASKRGPPSLFS
jgi:hypothetical protein